jgi:hypothetical protein
LIDLIALAATIPTPPFGSMAWFDKYFGLILGGGGLTLVGIFLTARAAKGKAKIDDLQSRFSSATALDEYIDGRIERVAGPLREEIEALRNRELSTKTILYAFFQRLMWWDERGRDGVMPMPEADDLTKLGVDLADLNTTQEHEHVRQAVRRMHERQAEADNVTDIHSTQNGTPA